ncbi:hypothetical protein ACW189_01440 [Limosilactobacillus fermentum]|nr:hypothetical protein [Limosilactobacillus fermentum]MDF4006820.1 hypothetical protein [Limosilactobacillus fermentum]MDF4015758.1 hypothetical protein [Limosilactobacillus fermentum]
MLTVVSALIGALWGYCYATGQRLTVALMTPISTANANGSPNY